MSANVNVTAAVIGNIVIDHRFTDVGAIPFVRLYSLHLLLLKLRR